MNRKQIEKKLAEHGLTMEKVAMTGGASGSGYWSVPGWRISNGREFKNLKEVADWVEFSLVR